jgi:hypothetical protein
VGANALPSLDETGLYVTMQDAEPDSSLVRMVVAKLDHGWTLGGAIDPGPQARSLPVAEMAASACRHPRVDAASVVVMPGRWTHAAHVILLVFAAEPDPAALSTSELKRRLSHDLGAAHAPDHVEVFALHPRYAEHGVHAGWCSSQYLSGMLGKKSRTPLFLTLSRLAWIFDPASQPA